MNKPGHSFGILHSALCIAAVAAQTASTVKAYTTSITDTTGYVVQDTSDLSSGGGQSSIIYGHHFPGGAPVAGKYYLVNNELTTRSPAAFLNPALWC